MAPLTAIVTMVGFIHAKGFDIPNPLGTGSEVVNSDICDTQIVRSSCMFFGCDASRGETYCLRSNHYCACHPGYCVASNSSCVRDPRVPESCKVDMHKTCLLNCDGDNVECDQSTGECMCSIGFCRSGEGDSATCVASSTTCQRGTPGTCSTFSCDSSRGPTDCLSDNCFCKEGFCWDDSHHTCVAEGAELGASFAALPPSREFFYPFRMAGVKAKHLARRFRGTAVLASLAAVATGIAAQRRRAVGASVEPLLAGNVEA